MPSAPIVTIALGNILLNCLNTAPLHEPQNGLSGYIVISPFTYILFKLIS